MNYRLLIIASLIFFSPVSYGEIWPANFPAQVEKNLQDGKNSIPIDGRYFFADRSTSIHLAVSLIQKTASDKETLGYSLKDICGDSYEGGSCILGQKVNYGVFFERVQELGHGQKLAELTSWVAGVCELGCQEYEVEVAPRIKATILITSYHDQVLLFYY